MLSPEQKRALSEKAMTNRELSKEEIESEYNLTEGLDEILFGARTIEESEISAVLDEMAAAKRLKDSLENLKSQK